MCGERKGNNFKKIDDKMYSDDTAHAKRKRRDWFGVRYEMN